MSTTEQASHDAALRPLPRNTIVPVAGISHHQAAAARTQIGDEVLLTHDQSNPYDVDAVAITTLGGDLLGHVPASSNLNYRLLVGHRGGVWGGQIVDRVGTETIGLRVKIMTLLGHRPGGFGSGIEGRRGPVAEPVVEPVSPAEHTPAHGADATAATAAVGGVAVVVRTVRTAGSGRTLGEYVDTVASRVRVRGAGGTITSYPAAVVTISDDDQQSA